MNTVEGESYGLECVACRTVYRNVPDVTINQNFEHFKKPNIQKTEQKVIDKKLIEKFPITVSLHKKYELYRWLIISLFLTFSMLHLLFPYILVPFFVGVGIILSITTFVWLTVDKIHLYQLRKPYRSAIFHEIKTMSSNPQIYPELHDERHLHKSIMPYIWFGWGGLFFYTLITITMNEGRTPGFTYEGFQALLIFTIVMILPILRGGMTYRRGKTSTNLGRMIGGQTTKSSTQQHPTDKVRMRQARKERKRQAKQERKRKARVSNYKNSDSQRYGSLINQTYQKYGHIAVYGSDMSTYTFKIDTVQRARKLVKKTLEIESEPKINLEFPKDILNPTLNVEARREISRYITIYLKFLDLSNEQINVMYKWFNDPDGGFLKACMIDRFYERSIEGFESWFKHENKNDKNREPFYMFRPVKKDNSKWEYHDEIRPFASYVNKNLRDENHQPTSIISILENNRAENNYDLQLQFMDLMLKTNFKAIINSIIEPSDEEHSVIHLSEVLTNMASETENEQLSQEFLRDAEILSPQDPGIMIERGKKLYGKGKLEEAIEQLQQAVEIDNENDALFIEIAKIQSELGNHDKVIDNLLKAGDLSPKFLEINERILLSEAYLEVGQYEKSLEVINEVVDRDPREIKYLKSRAYINEKLGNIEASSKDYEIICQLNRDKIENHLKYASLLIRKNDLELAENVLRSTTDLEINNIDRHILSGSISYRKKEFTKAKMYFEKAISSKLDRNNLKIVQDNLSKYGLESDISEVFSNE